MIIGLFLKYFQSLTVESSGWHVIDVSCSFINVVCFFGQERWEKCGVAAARNLMMKYQTGTFYLLSIIENYVKARLEHTLD